MKINTIIPLVNTDKLAECKRFWCEHFAMKLTFESPEYVGLATADGAQQIAFMRPCADASAYDGKGLALCIEVDDVDAEHARLTKEGVAFVVPPKDNPYGDRSAIAMDPVGVCVYIFKPIPPAPEFEGYFVR